MKIGLDNSNEMCLQGLNLSSTQKSAFHHDLALLQQAMNAVGGLLPTKVKTLIYILGICNVYTKDNHLVYTMNILGMYGIYQGKYGIYHLC